MTVVVEAVGTTSVSVGSPVGVGVSVVDADGVESEAEGLSVVDISVGSSVTKTEEEGLVDVVSSVGSTEGTVDDDMLVVLNSAVVDG